jgi:hypothetical protein
MEIQTKFLLSQVRRVRYERVYDTFNGGGKIQTKITPTGEKKWWVIFFFTDGCV